MSIMTIRADVEIDTNDLDMDELVQCISTSTIEQELYNRGRRSLLDLPDDTDQTLGAISTLLHIRPEDRKNKDKIIEAIKEL